MIVLITGCWSKEDCREVTIEIAYKYEGALFENNEEGNGFSRITTEFRNMFANDSAAILYLKENDPNSIERRQVLEQFGPYLLTLAISSGEIEDVEYLLNNNIDSFNYYQYIGIPILNLLQAQDKQLYTFLKTHLPEDKVQSAMFKEVEYYYEKCVL